MSGTTRLSRSRERGAKRVGFKPAWLSLSKGPKLESGGDRSHNGKDRVVPGSVGNPIYFGGAIGV